MFNLFKRSPEVFVKLSENQEDNYFMGKILVREKNKTIVNMSFMVELEKKNIILNDIQFATRKKYNKGYGTLAMNRLIQIAKEYNIISMEGWISQVDNDHLERLYHFYEKFGFEIIPNSDGMKIADIRLSIEE